MESADHFGQVFTDFQKSDLARWGLTFSVTELVLVNKSLFLSNWALFLWTDLTLAIVEDNIKMNSVNHFGYVFRIFRKSDRDRWGLTFLITELCCGHDFVTFGPIGLNFFMGRLHFSHSWGSNKKWTWRTILDKFLPISEKVTALD